MEEPVAFPKSHFSLVFWGREVMITYELGSISLLSLVPFYIFRQSRVLLVFGEEKDSVKFNEPKKNNK